jgi:hypothetical protein
VILPDWPWTNPYYKIELDLAPTTISKIILHSTGHIADIQNLNDQLIIPEKWDWTKHKLALELVKKKNKAAFQKLVKIKKEN